jgi:tetratricopeptide (TPR) repeat protein
MTYPGNPSLSTAVKERVLSTFQQTLALYHQGRSDEVAAGCNLILQMDPMFDPARRLFDKSRNPALPIDVDSLLPRDTRNAMQQAREAMAERDFQRVVHITTEILTNDLLNDEARILGDEARDKMEAGPFVDQFARKCDQYIASGNIAAAKADLEKARALDPTHPEVVRIAMALAGRDAAPAPKATPSFVVDSPAPARSTAQAADFGFSFEEEKPAAPAAEVSFANFSFDTPSSNPSDPFGGGFSFDAAPAAPAPAAPAPATSAPGEFDFATASVVTSSEDATKISQFLADGDRAFAAGDYQGAIDFWSRIFLIDVTNEEASQRIERAKAKRRELEQKIEPLLASGVAAFERGDTSRAHTDLTEVLRIDPDNATAQQYLDRLGDTVNSTPAAAYIPPSIDEDKDFGFVDEEPSGGFDTPLVPPSPSSAASSSGKRETASASKSKAPSGGRKLPMTAIAAVIGALLLLGAGWFVWSRFMSKPETDPAATQAILARASSLASTGKYDQAIQLLQDIQPTDPAHDQALVMIADLRAKKATSAEMIGGVPASQFFDQKLAAGRVAFEAHDYVGAKLAFEQAQSVKPLPADAKAQYDRAAQQVAKLDAAKALFTERRYTEAISNLESLAAEDPQNQNVRRMITDAHFNLGATALQEERTADAIREFESVLAANPDDELAKRSHELAVRYNGESKDLLYRIYVKYLPLRNAT